MFRARFKTAIYSNYGDQADVDVPGGKGKEGRADTVKMLQEALTMFLASGFGTLERKHVSCLECCGGLGLLCGLDTEEYKEKKSIRNHC